MSQCHENIIIPINIDQWQVTTGLFYSKVYVVIPNNKNSYDCNMKILIFLFFFYSAFVFLILLMDGDIEHNPGPKTKTKKPNLFSCCHWNVNSLLAHNKLSMLEAYNIAQKYVTCISESYLDSTVPLDDNSLSLNGYNRIWADHPYNAKRRGVCKYYKENLSLRIVSTSFFIQCLLCEVTCQNQKGYIAVIYCSPIQSCNGFEDFLFNLEKLINQIKQLKPSFTVILGDFNARSSDWWLDDITSPEGTYINSLTSMYGFDQLISDPTHILPASSSCIDLIFNDQPNLVVGSGVHPSLHNNCHHQITYCNLNLMIVYLPPYERLVWDDKRATESAINAALNKVDWEFLFSNKSVNQQAIIFNRTVMNIFSNLIPSKFVTFNDRDPPWMTSNIKHKINYRNNIYWEYLKKGKQQADYMKLQNTIKELSELISTRKDDYNLHLANKLTDPTTISKTLSKLFWRLSIVPEKSLLSLPY